MQSLRKYPCCLYAKYSSNYHPKDLSFRSRYKVPLQFGLPFAAKSCHTVSLQKIGSTLFTIDLSVVFSFGKLVRCREKLFRMTLSRMHKLTIGRFCCRNSSIANSKKLFTYNCYKVMATSKLTSD